MYFLLKMVIFHCHVSLLKGIPNGINPSNSQRVILAIVEGFLIGIPVIILVVTVTVTVWVGGVDATSYTRIYPLSKEQPSNNMSFVSSTHSAHITQTTGIKHKKHSSRFRIHIIFQRFVQVTHFQHISRASPVKIMSRIRKMVGKALGWDGGPLKKSTPSGMYTLVGMKIGYISPLLGIY